MSQRSVGGVPGARHTLALLQALARQPGPVPAASLARELGLPRSTTYHLLDTLVRAGFVVHVAEERRYALGVSAFELGSGYARQAPLPRLARPLLARLVDASARTRTWRSCTAATSSTSSRSARRAASPDHRRRRPAARPPDGQRPGDAGRPARARRCARSSRTPARSSTGTDRGRGARPRSGSCWGRRAGRGFASEDGEVTPEFASVAAAASDRAGYPVAAVAVTFPSAEVDAAGAGASPRGCARTAAELSPAACNRPGRA